MAYSVRLLLSPGDQLMSYEFECPNGHRLEAEERQAGDECRCPECDVLFQIPAPQVSVEIETGSQVDSALPDGFDPSRRPDPNLFHIPCPNGHILETPKEMLGQAAACPYCGVEYRLKKENSQEYRQHQMFQQRAKDRKASNFWFNLTIVFAVVIVIGLLIMIISSSR